MASDGSSEALAVLAARAGCPLNRSIPRFGLGSDQNLRHLEGQAAQDVQELLWHAIERGVQTKADATPPVCPVCGQLLSRLSGGHPRTFRSRLGAITIRRTLGYCKHWRKGRVPADAALGLEETADYSPAVQGMAALLASNMPVGDASAVPATAPCSVRKPSGATAAGTSSSSTLPPTLLEIEMRALGNLSHLFT